MIEYKLIDHHIQKHIIDVLMYQKYARFRDMRPPNTDTNLYSYHLKLLLKANLVAKIPAGYTLSTYGQSYVDRITASTGKLSVQPKVITMAVIQNDYGGILMYQKLRQPFISRWTVPFGKVHNSDRTIAGAAQREIAEKIGEITVDLQHAGDCYIRVVNDGTIAFSTMTHVFYGQLRDDVPLADHMRWVSPHELTRLDTAPAIKAIIARTFFRDPYFFEEFTEQW